ncbi:hypothetical protein HZS_2645, partial [Henneguya salminicola]
MSKNVPQKLNVNQYSKYAKVLSLLSEEPVQIQQEEIDKNKQSTCKTLYIAINKAKQFLELISKSNEDLKNKMLSDISAPLENMENINGDFEMNLLILSENDDK